MVHQFRAAPESRRVLPSADVPTTWNNRFVDWSAKVVFPQTGYRLMQERPARIIRISEGDTLLKMSTPNDIRETFYVQLEVDEQPLIPCWVMRKSPSAIYAHFHRQLSREELDKFQEIYETRASLEALLQVIGA
jgi:hypothetical protein